MKSEEEFQKLANKYREKLSSIKCLAFDCDGILTDSHIWWAGEEVGFARKFHTLDGYGLKLLMRNDFHVAIISGGDSLGLIKRIENLKIKHSYLGDENKLAAFTKLLEDTGVEPHEVCYMGDELFDVPLLRRSGFSVTVPHAVPEVKDVCDYVTESDGGKGCVREFIEIFRRARGLEVHVEDFKT